MPVTVSVVMPVRDMAATVGAQLAALARQDYPGRWELLVVDNGSTDDSLAEVLRWRDQLPMQIIGAGEVAECGYAKNAGAAAASGELLVFCDADDEARPEWLGAMVDALRRHHLVAGEFAFDRLNPPEVAADHAGIDLRAPRWGFLPAATGASLGIRRSTFEALGGFRFGRGADTALCWRARLAGYELAFESNAIVDKRIRPLTPWRLFRAALVDGQRIVGHYREFRSEGMRRSPLRDIVYDLLMIPLHLIAGRRFEAARTAGYRFGRLIGSVHTRTLCP